MSEAPPPPKRKRAAKRAFPTADAVASSSSAQSLVPPEFGHRLQGALRPVGGDLARLRAQICQLVGENMRENKPKLPGPQPFAVTRRKLKLLETRDYWVCEKSDGLRVMLLVTREGAFFADRKFDVYAVINWKPYVQALGGCESGPTLLDGELVESLKTGRDTFMLFDTIARDGDQLFRLPYEKRIDALSKVGLACGTMLDPKSVPFFVQAKKFYKKADVSYVFQNKLKRPSVAQPFYSFVCENAKIANKNDGLVFTPNDSPYLNKDGSLLKWKWPGMNTVDFLLDVEAKRATSTGWIVDAHVGTPSEHTARVTTVSLTHEDERAIDREHHRSSIVAECAYDREQGVWRIKHFRWDKEIPNFITTAWNTLETEVDNVTEEDICRASGSAVP